jgi:hypothetical protein
MSRSSQFLAANPAATFATTATSQNTLLPTAARISHPPSIALDSNFSREFWSPVFADDQFVNNETVAFSPLPHNPAFHPRHFSPRPPFGRNLQKRLSRAEDAPTVPRFAE